MLRRATLALLGSLVITLLWAAVAMAGWAPQDIYDDFVNHGKLTREYTDPELNAYLNDAMIDMYGDQEPVDRLDAEVVRLLDRDEFPFTGFQLMIAGLVAVGLIGGGVAVRLLSRPRGPSALS